MKKGDFSSRNENVFMPKRLFSLSTNFKMKLDFPVS